MVKWVAVLTVLWLAACSSEPVMQSGADAERMPGGLYKIDHSRVDEAFIKPDVDFGAYKGLWVKSLEFADKLEPDKNRSRSSFDRPGASWEPREQDRELLRKAWADVTQTELGEKSRYSIAEQKAPGVLLIQAKLVEVELTAPVDDAKSRNVSARSAIYTETSGSMTMELSLYDAVSGEKLAYFRDKRTAPKMWRENNSIRNLSDARLIMNGWAIQLRKHLDQAYAP